MLTAQIQRTAKFFRTADELRAQTPVNVPLRYAFEFIADGETIGRVLNDYGVRCLMPFIEGDGAIIELGGNEDYYKNFARDGQPYKITNLSPGFDEWVDMTAMPYGDNSIDAFFSMFALEHIYDYQAVVDECFRCLKPGGRLMFAVPFLYYYHAAPDDYFRFTASALKRMFSGFDILTLQSYGNRSLVVTQLFHDKKILGSRYGRLARFLLRLCALPILVRGLLSNQHNPTYAVTHLIVCQKRSEP